VPKINLPMRRNGGNVGFLRRKESTSLPFRV
jgi:hypothetical protein